MTRSRLLSCLLLTASLATVTPTFATDVQHPLDPLSESEINRTVALLQARADFPKPAFFSDIHLQEPPKADVLAYRTGDSFERKVCAIVYDNNQNKTYRGIIDLNANSVASWQEIKGVQPLVAFTEFDDVDKIAKADPRWQAAMRKRGITDFSQVVVDGWAPGHYSRSLAGRLLRGITYFKGNNTNYYGRPVEGVTVTVNMNLRQVVDIIDTGAIPVADHGQDFDEKSVGPQREKPKPLYITQPEGASYRVNGYQIEWQKWRMRYSIHPREGLVLHTVSYNDDGNERQVLYRAALSEMVVPYGDPDPNWNWRAAFDAGEYGIGRLASPLEPNQDAPPNAQFFDATFADDFGKTYKLEKAVAIYERDGGLLWKHYDTPSGKNESRRARDLVLLAVATIGNYDYAIHYIFKQDGTLEVELALSGIMLAKGVAPLEADTQHHGIGETISHRVDEFIVAPHHQHFFNFRLDMDVDGVNNTAKEMNTYMMPSGYRNPNQNGFLMRESTLYNEKQAQRNIEIQTARLWNVTNPAISTALGHHPGYILAPGNNTVPFIAPNASARQRAQFINNHFWVTRYNPDELYAAGDFPNQSLGGDGLPRYAANNESVENQDIVVWYTVGITHIPRPEEWSVMPATRLGFKLIPAGFFDRNPAIDVPR